MVLTRNYKFRLYPNDYQEKRLQNNLAVCRWVYNKFVEYAQKGFVSRNDCNYLLTEIKQTEDWPYQYHSKMLQSISTQIDGSQKALIERSKRGYKTGNLRFCRYYDFRTFTYSQTGFKLERKRTANLCGDTKSINETRRDHYTCWVMVHNYLLRARIVICNATMSPIDAIIGNINALS